MNQNLSAADPATKGGGRPWRVGHLYPSGGLCEHEVQLMASQDVRFLTTRMPFRHTGLTGGLDTLFDELEASANLLADAQVDLIAVNCTAATMLAGADRINQRVMQATGIRSVTTIQAVLAALRVSGMRRVALLTPYMEEVVQAEIAFLAAQGVQVVASGGRACASPVEQGEIPAAYWLEAGRQMAHADCDGLLISCAGIQLAPVLAELERQWRRPVLSSNQALAWHCMRTLKLNDRNIRYGGLFAR